MAEITGPLAGVNGISSFGEQGLRMEEMGPWDWHSVLGPCLN